eukprot:2611998-Pyramimonas_sp.AAC.1
MREMLLFFLPRGSCPDDAAHGVTRSPETTRPLAPCDPDAKLVSFAFGSPLAELPEFTVHADPRGGVKGRAMSSNIAIADRWCVQQHLGGGPNSLQLLTDVAAALPSLH